MKKQEGFSLVELLVVVAIIGVLAGVGVVGMQQYTEASKVKVSEQNLNNVIRYFTTELIILNNDIVSKSATIKINNSTPWQKNVHSLDDFLNGAADYHDLGFGLANFRNPFKNRQAKQVFSTSNIDDNNNSNLTDKGNIVLRVHPNFPSNGSEITGDRNFQIIYYKEDGVLNNEDIYSFVLK